MDSNYSVQYWIIYKNLSLKEKNHWDQHIYDGIFSNPNLNLVQVLALIIK